MMTDDERVAAIRALVAWLESQGIEPGDAVPILSTVTIWSIVKIAKQADVDPEGGLTALIEGQKAQLKQLEKMIEQEKRDLPRRH